MIVGCLDPFISRHGDIHFERSWRRLRAESESSQTTPRSLKREITTTRHERVLTSLVSGFLSVVDYVRAPDYLVPIRFPIRLPIRLPTRLPTGEPIIHYLMTPSRNAWY